MIACYTPRGVSGRGVSFSINDIYAMIANAAGQGSNTAGQITTGLLNAGVAVGAIQQALQTIASNTGTDQQTLLTVQQELAYLNNGYIPAQRNDWVLPVLGLGVLAVFLLRRRNS